MASVTANSPAVPARAAPGGGGLAVKLFYGLGSVAYGVKDNGFSVLLLLFYNQVLGLDARLAGLAIMIALVVDACMDPTIGYLSDRLRTRIGRRHPFMYAAALPVTLSYLLLFSPPAHLAGTGLFTYLLAVAIMVRVFISFYEIPSSALVAELTFGYDERTSFLSYRYFFGWLSGLSMTALAFSVFLRGNGAQTAPYLAAAGYRHYGYAAAAIMLCSILISAIGTQSAVMTPRERGLLRAPAPRGVLTELRAALGTRSAQTATVAGILLQLATGLTFALSMYFYLYAWQLSQDQISTLSMAAFAAAALALVLSPRIAARFDKKSATLGCTALLLALLPLPLFLGLLGLMPSAASGLLLPCLICYNIVSTTAFIIVPTLISSMLADVVEEVELRTERRLEGVIFALNTFVQKCASALGVFLSTWMLSAARFPSHVVTGQVPVTIINHLAGFYIGTVAMLYIASLVCVSFYAITRARHVDNLRVLASRRTGQA